MTATMERTVTAADIAAERAVTGSDAPPQVDRPRPIRARTFDDWMCLVGSLIGSVAFTFVLYEYVLPFSGKFGFVVFWYLTFIAFYALTTAVRNPGPLVVDRIVSSIIYGAAIVVAAALVSVVVYTVVKGYPAWSHSNFFIRDMTGVDADNAVFTQGGIEHAILGSLVEVGIAVLIALPLGVITAVFMAEVGGRFGRIVRTVIEAMTALPDLVAGLFVYALLVVALHGGKSGMAAAIALSITMLPIIARSSDVVLRVLPGGLREAAYALGAPQWRVVWNVVLPTARSGLGTALILGIARGMGESAPLLIVATAGNYSRLNPFAQDMNSLPLFIYTELRRSAPGSPGITRAYGAASVLLFLVIVLFIVIRVLSRRRGGSR